MFSPFHIPVLVQATATTFGGMWPLWNARGAMLEFGWPARVAETPETHLVMAQGQSRTTILGLLTFIFYFRGQYEDDDTLLAVIGFYTGVVDSYVVWRAGKPATAAFRLVASWAFAACGLAGLTARSR